MKTTMHFMRAFSLSVFAGVLLCSAVMLAQHSTVTPRIQTNVDELSLTTLSGNVPHLARAEFDQGEADPATLLAHMRLVLSRSSEQQAALDSYLAQLQDKFSPNYHKWLTPEQFGQLYGPADSDIAALVAWLESHGFQVDPISPGRTNIAFSGSVSQVEVAFHTSIHSFQAGEQQFFSNTSDPQIPSALATVVMGVAHLNTISPRPHSVQGKPGRINPQTGRLEPLSAGQETEAVPNLTTTSGGDTLWIVPADAATIYDTPNTFNANFSGTACGSSSGCTGAGVKIGVGGVATIGTGSIAQTYRSTLLGSSYATAPSIITTGTGLKTDTSDVNEAYIDVELSGGLAPGATIYYYPSSDLLSGIDTAITANVVDIFSLSWGECEADMGSDNALLNGYWELAAADGIAVTVSTGDTGSASCDDDRNGTIRTAIDGLSVSGYASTPYNIAVGGTDLSALESSFSSYVSTSSGSSGTYYRTVLASGPGNGYIPESVWNDSTQNDTLSISGNVPWTGTSANIIAGSGGASSCATGSGATCAGYSKPAWQTGSGVPADGVRDLPDVSVMSGNGYDRATWLICDGTYDCSSISGGNYDGYGGTSTAAPAFAGILALVQQKTGSRLGQAAQELYSLYNGSHASAIFHDVMVGNNSVPCNSGTSNCVDDIAGYYFESGYNAVAGYDLASGLGSVDATQLVNYWSSSNGSTTITLSATSPSPIAPGGTAVSTVTVSSTNGYAGTVTLTCALTNYPSGAKYLPSCTGGSNTVTLSSGTTSGQATITVYTTAASAALSYPRLPGRGRGLFGAGGGAVLALLVLLGIPARRRSWRSILGILVVMAALGSLAACGGGGGGGGNSGTTAGTYTFTVTGTGNPIVNPAPTTTFTVTVN
jgi:subtilase family serine protease